MGAGFFFDSHPWFQWSGPQCSNHPTAAVIGAGVAGASIAHHLAQYGVRVQVFEKKDKPASGASGNPGSLISLSPTLQSNEHSVYSFYCFKELVSFLSKRKSTDGWNPSGVLRIEDYIPPQIVAEYGDDWVALDEKPPFREKDVLKVPRGGVLNPTWFCKTLLTSPLVELKTETSIKDMKWHGHSWELFSDESLGEFDFVVMANSFAIRDFPSTSWLPLDVVRGQCVVFEDKILRQSPALQSDFYLGEIGNQTVLGASFDRGSLSATARPEETRQLLEKLAGLDKELAGRTGSCLAYPWVGFRGMSKDKMPMVGPVPHLPQFVADYQNLHHGRTEQWPTAATLPNLFVLTGLGSKGMTFAFGGAKLLAQKLMTDKIDCPEPVLNALNPARFIIRELKKSPKDRDAEFSPQLS